MITPEEFAEQMKLFATSENKYGHDTEMAHIQADEFMCITLELLGYRDGVEIFRNMPKWYA